jgi:hypothetical protein
MLSPRTSGAPTQLAPTGDTIMRKLVTLLAAFAILAVTSPVRAEEPAAPAAAPAGETAKPEAKPEAKKTVKHKKHKAAAKKAAAKKAAEEPKTEEPAAVPAK